MSAASASEARRRPEYASSAATSASTNGNTMTIASALRSRATRIGPIILLRAALAGAILAASAPAAAADPAKVLRLATSDIDTLDPQQWQDAFSARIGETIFEALYEWDPFGSPPLPVPNTAAGPPEISPDGLTWTVRLKPGIRFSDDPAFGGRPRELVADDFVYTLKRTVDPNLRGGGDPLMTDLVAGLRPLVDAARRPGATFDYDAPVAGAVALDRHTLRLTFTAVNYPVAYSILTTVRAVAREVVAAAGGDIQARAVGTGPYVLREWRRGSRVVLEAHPGYRPLAYPDSRDPAHAALVAGMRGKRLPQIGRIELAVIDEQQTRLLEFERGTLDLVSLRGEGARGFLVGDDLDPKLAARGIRRLPWVTNSVRALYLNMDDPVVGGDGVAPVALRRALGLAIDVDALIRVVYWGQGLPAAQIVPPGVAGYDAAFPRRPYDPRLARALLDRAGYAKRDAQGYRLRPDGKPLALSFSIFPGSVWREFQTLVRRDFDAIGVRVDFRVVPTQDLFKEAAQGKFQINVHGRSVYPMGLAFSTLYGPSPPEDNETRFRNAQYDLAFERFLRAPDPAARHEAARTMSTIVAYHAPMIPLMVDVENAFVQPWVLGYFPAPFTSMAKYLDVDLARMPARR